MDFDKDKMNPKYPCKFTGKAIVLTFATVLTLSYFSMQPQIKAESIAGTISKALEDIGSDDSELRRGGVMLLGKYSSQPGVLDALSEMLTDTNVGVRRAAAVTLVGSTGQLNAQQAIRLLDALDDPDKEVRVSIATWLPQIILRARNFPPDQKTRTSIIRNPVLSALMDTEPLVRRKAVESLKYLNSTIAPDELIHLFADPDPQVRLAAYPAIKRFMSGQAYTSAALAHFPDPDPSARLSLTEAVAKRPAPEMKPLLLRLAEDPIPAINLQAEIGLFLIDPAEGLPSELQAALESNSLEQSLMLEIISGIRLMSFSDRKSTLDLLLQSERPFIRGQAISLRLHELDSPPPPGTFETYLKDPAPEVRQQAINVVLSRPDLVDPKLIMALPDNPYLDVRQRVLSLLRHLDPNQQSQTLTRLLLDTEPSIRTSALKRIAQTKPQNWQVLFRASLRDPSPQVRQRAADTLLRKLGPEGIEIASAHSAAHPEQEISRYIRQQLSRFKIQ